MEESKMATLSTIYAWLNNYAGRDIKIWHGDTEPGSARCEDGHLWVDTANHVIKIYNGSSWIAGDSSFDDIASTGTLTMTGTKTIALNITGAYTTSAIKVAVGAKEGINVGAFHSTLKGSGLVLSNTITGNNRFYSDDNGAVISAADSVPDVRNVLARTLITKDNSANSLRLHSLMGHLTSYDGAWGNEQVSAVHGYLELVRNAGTINFQNYGVTAGLMATVENIGTMVVDANHVLAGVAAISKLTSDLTQTGKAAAFYAGIYNTSQWSDGTARSKWGFGLYVPASAVTEGIRVGDSADTAGSGVSMGDTTAAVRVHVDDGGAAITGDRRALLARYLLTVEQTGAHTASAIRGQLKLASGVDFSSADAVVSPIGGLLEQAGNSSFTGRGGVLRANWDAGSGNITVAASSLYAGFLAELRCTGTVTATGNMAAFATYATSNEASYKKWPWGMFMNADSVSAILNAGSSSSRVTNDTASTKFIQIYADCGATSGEAQGIYDRLYVSGAGGSGSALRAFCTVENVAAVDARGAHISLNFGDTGTVTGSGQALTTTLHIANQATQSGHLSAITTEIYSDGTDSDPAGAVLSCIRMSNAGSAKDDVDDDCFAFHFDEGFTVADGNMIAIDGSPTTMPNAVYSIRIRIGSTTAYLYAGTNALTA
jgi:hypothetical protein